eukprot:gene11511-biopygen9183
MVERFHRQLKASVKAQPDPSMWSEILPVILRSIRCTFKPDLDAIPAQLVYGTTLRLPGQFFTPTTITSLDPTVYSQRLQFAMEKLRPVSLRPQRTSAHLPHGLATCTHIFVRHDAIRKPLQQPYDCPFKILRRNDKHFTLEIKAKPQTITLDRFKPAHVDVDRTDTPNSTPFLPPSDAAPPQSPSLAPASPSPPPAMVPCATRLVVMFISLSVMDLIHD